MTLIRIITDTGVEVNTSLEAIIARVSPVSSTFIVINAIENYVEWE